MGILLMDMKIDLTGVDFGWHLYASGPVRGLKTRLYVAVGELRFRVTVKDVIVYEGAQKSAAERYFNEFPKFLKNENFDEAHLQFVRHSLEE